MGGIPFFRRKNCPDSYSEMDYTYRTIQEPAEGVYKEKGSKFLAFAYPVETEEEVKENIDRLKKEFFDARHNVHE